MAGETFSASFPSFIQVKAAVDFPAMVAGSAIQTLAVVGANVADAVLVCRPNDTTITDELTLSGYVETADVVTISVVSNVVGATTDLAAVTLTVLVFK